MQDFQYIKNVATLDFHTQRCVGCGICTMVCPHGVFEMNGRKAKMQHYNKCMECGACALNCPSAAIDVNPGVGCAAAIIGSWLKKAGLSKADSPGCC